MKMVTMVTIKMKINDEVWTPLASYLIFCDGIDPSFSLTNFETDSNGLNQSKLLGLFPRGQTNIILPIYNKKELTHLTLWLRNTDMTTPTKDNTAILNLVVFHHEQ